MIKKCMGTGLKYLCKTSSAKVDNDRLHLYRYKGSGVRWLNHIKKHRSWVVTCVIGCYKTKEELADAGLFYSKLFDVVGSAEWANLTEERGDGGLIGSGQLGKKWKMSDTARQNVKASRKQMSISGRLKEKIEKMTPKISGKNNYQFKGMVQTPWGTFDSMTSAGIAAAACRIAGNNNVITDGATLRKYIENLSTPLAKDGRRTPPSWRGKTPLEIGFNLLQEGKDDV
jgi:hypothetical protein